MATLIVYASEPDNYLASQGANQSAPPYQATSYSQVRAGNNVSVQFAGQGYPSIIFGQERYQSAGYYAYGFYEAFIQFDTSPIGAVSTIEGVTLNMVGGLGIGLGEIRVRDWGGTLEVTDFVPGASLGAAGTLVATWTGGNATNIALNANINKTGWTRYILATDRMRIGTQPTAAEIGQAAPIHISGGVPIAGPLLTIVYGAANSGAASATIPSATFAAAGEHVPFPPFTASIIVPETVIAATGSVTSIAGAQIFTEVPVLRSRGNVLTDHYLQSLDEALVPVHTPTYRFQIKWDGINWIDETLRFRSAGGVSDVNEDTRLQNIDQANFELDNTDHRFSITNTASPIYAHLNQLNQVVQIDIGWEGVYDQFFYGNITSLKPDVRTGTVQISALSFADRFAKVQTHLAPAANLLTSEVARRLLVTAGFNEGTDFALDPGTVTVQYAMAPNESSLLEELLWLTQVENGRLFFDPAHEGRLTMQSAITNADASASPAAVLSTDDHLYDLEREVSPTGMANQITFEWLYRDIGDDKIGDYDPNLAPLWSNYTVGANAVQDLKIVATSGQYRLGWGSEWPLSGTVPTMFYATGGIEFNATAAYIRAALLNASGSASTGYGYGNFYVEELSRPGYVPPPNMPPGYDQPGEPNTFRYRIYYGEQFGQMELPLMHVYPEYAAGAPEELPISTGLRGTGTVTEVVRGSDGTGSLTIQIPFTGPETPFPVVFFPGYGATESWDGEQVSFKTAWRAYVPVLWTQILNCNASFSPTFAAGNMCPDWKPSKIAATHHVPGAPQVPGQPSGDPTEYFYTYYSNGYSGNPSQDAELDLTTLPAGPTQVFFVNNYTPGRSIYVRIRLGGKPGELAPRVQTAVDEASVARYGQKPLTLQNPYKPSDAIAQQVVNRELARRSNPASTNVIFEADGMPLRALDYVQLTDTTVPGISLVQTHAVLSNEWRINEQGLRSTLKVSAI